MAHILDGLERDVAKLRNVHTRIDILSNMGEDHDGELRAAIREAMCLSTDVAINLLAANFSVLASENSLDSAAEFLKSVNRDTMARALKAMAQFGELPAEVKEILNAAKANTH